MNMPNNNPKSLPSPYNLSLHNGFYVFNTDNDVTYTCGFRDVTSTLSPVIGVYEVKVFDFEFFPHDPKPEVRKPIDDRVSATVIDLMKGFFVDPLRVLIYACDAADGRARERQLLFKQWHRNIQDTINRDEIEVEIEELDAKAYGCVLTRKDFPHMDVLQSELIDKAKDIVLEKFNP